MLKDLHTVEGQQAMSAGKHVEQVFFNHFKRTPIEWISADSDKQLAGHDFIIGGKRVELKSNSGVDSSGAAYSTVCVEITTRGGNPIGWSQKKSDIVVFVNRRDMMAHMYRADELRRFAKIQRTFIKYDAECFLMDWITPRAGWISSIQL